jgi:NitT/TauT family transport system permease protein
MIRIYKLLPHFLFLALFVLIHTPSYQPVENKWPFVVVVVMIEIAFIFKRKFKSACDITLIVFLFLIIWEIGTVKLPNPNSVLYPMPEKVFAVFVKDWQKIIIGFGSSMSLFFTALFFGLLFGVSGGMVVGWYERPRKALFPIARVISPIPPIIYNPYVVGILPSFRTASLFIIFSSIFWPVFVNTIINVSNVDRRILESAKTINTRPFPMFINILLPYCLPRLLTSLNVTLSIAFMVLTSAELIGAKSGLGYYVKFYADFVDYTRVIAGIILIGVVVTVMNKLLSIIQKLIIRWR